MFTLSGDLSRLYRQVPPCTLAMHVVLLATFSNSAKLKKWSFADLNLLPSLNKPLAASNRRELITSWFGPGSLIVPRANDCEDLILVSDSTLNSCPARRLFPFYKYRFNATSRTQLLGRGRRIAGYRSFSRFPTRWVPTARIASLPTTGFRAVCQGRISYDRFGIGLRLALRRYETRRLDLLDWEIFKSCQILIRVTLWRW